MLQLNLGNNALIFDRPAVMGILNVTPDSFSDGGRYNQMDMALQHCEQMLAEGADFIDIGGCSTRPNNAIATEQEETERVVPILKAIKTAFPDAMISIDTFRKNVAEACMADGADIINDISGGLFDTEMLPFIGQNHIPYVMMHCVGTPETMHQYALQGILIGISRKSLINKVLHTIPDTAENGTTVLNTIALLNGADILRVHDVKNAREAIELVGTFCNFAQNSES